MDNCTVSGLIDIGISTDIVYQELSNLIIENINDWREENGLNRLETLEFMNDACMVRAEELSINNSHTRPNGKAAASVYEDLFGASMGGLENIASNQALLSVTLVDAADTLFEQWKNSSGHNANMLSNTEYIGCGVYVNSDNVYSATYFSSIDRLEKAGYDNWL